MSRKYWVTGLAHALDLKTIYWHLLFPYLATVEGEGEEEGGAWRKGEEGVDYVEFLKRYQVQVRRGGRKGERGRGRKKRKRRIGGY